MSRFVTLAAMRTALQTRGGYENSIDLTSTVLNDFINEAVAEVWDILKSKRDDRLVVSITAATTPNVAFIDLSALDIRDLNGNTTSFYELRKLEIADSSAASGWRRLRKIDLDVSHLYSVLYGKRYRYRIQGSGVNVAGSTAALFLHPTPTVAETLRLFVVPAAPILSADGHNFDSVSGYEQLVYEIAFRMCKERQEQDTSSIERQIARMTARIAAAADGIDDEPCYLSPYGASGAHSTDDDMELL